MSESSTRSVVITQSNYIPWKGYFDQINSSDYFVFYDCVQYTRRDWRNRNKIKTAQGVKWLTIPVSTKGNFSAPISEIEVANCQWAEEHWNLLRHAYKKAPCFGEVEPFIKGLYESAATQNLLTEINKMFIKELSRFLGIATVFRDSSEFGLLPGRTERLLGICEAIGATNYISGPAAKNYLDESCFNEKDISVSWFGYEGYSEYPQLHGDFVHGVSVLDLLFSVGGTAKDYLKRQSRSE